MGSLLESLQKGWALPADPKTSYAGRTVLVTGANSGLGHAAAVKYAALGADTLILGVRNEEKGAQAKAAIVAATGCPEERLVVETLEMTSFDSVLRFARRVSERFGELHVVQLAAGVVSSAYTPTEDGYEASVQVDVLSTTLLALALLPKLRATARAAAARRAKSGGNAGDPKTDLGRDGIPHLSFVNSHSHQSVLPAWIPAEGGLITKMNDPARFDVGSLYLLIKLAGMLAARAVAERVSRWPDEKERIVVNTTCPGMCRTDQARNFGAAARWSMTGLYYVIGRSAEQGSRTLVSATSRGPGSHGKFWTNDEYVGPSKFMEGERGQRLYHETWDEITAILKKHASSDIVEMRQ